MLDKIVNIKSDLNFKSRGYSSTGRKAGSAYQQRFSVHDSVRFSPAVSFLSRVDWHLKDVSHSGQDKLRVVFSIAEFEIHAEIDFLKYNSESRQIFEIKSDFELANRDETVLLTVSVKKTNLHPDDEPGLMDPKTLRELFLKIVFLEFTGEFDKYDSLAIGNLLDGIKQNIFREFEYINTAFFTLVEKLMPGNFPHKFISKEDPDEPVIIEKIKVVANAK